MNFADVLLRLEKELQGLKVAASYTTTNPAGVYQSEGGLDGGIYRITYAAGKYPVISIITGGEIGEGLVSVCAPTGNTQLFWIEAGSNYPVSIIATRRVLSVEKIT